MEKKRAPKKKSMQGWAIRRFEDHMKRSPTEAERIEIEKAVKRGVTKNQVEKALETFRPMLPKGLINLGNTCYMNSALQLLMTCPQFVNNTRFDTFVRRMDPKLPRNWVAKEYPQFRNWAQHDSHEWLLALLDVCKDKLFEGEFTVDVQFDGCGHTNTHQEPFVTISLPIVGTTMASAMEHFFQEPEEVFSTCDTCKDHVKKKALKFMSISKVPTYLIVHWKRFDKRGNKIKTRMATPFHLFNKVISGTVNHAGSLHAGHYTACVRHGSQWRYISDSQLMEIEERHAMKSSEVAYMVVYQ